MGKGLEGKTALITGGNSGIGRATALLMAREGANLALVGRNRQRLDQVVEEVQALGVQAQGFEADIAQPQQIEQAIAQAAARFGRIHIAHLNAGIYLRCPAAELTMEQIRAIMDNNFYGTLNALYPLLAHMKAQGGGSIVATLSMDGKKGVPPDGAYVASKFALNGFFQVLRQELRGSSIHIGAVFPSHTDTPQIAHVACPPIAHKMQPEQVAQGVLRCVLGRKPEVLVPGPSCKLLVLCDAVSPRLGDLMVRLFRLGGEQTGQPIV